jgi:two-component system OmpR family response regulator
MGSAFEHVLVVDDDREVREVTGEFLTLRGFAVTLASDGHAALGLVRRGLRPDLVIVDENMPGMQGDELARQLRQQLEREDLPVLITTGNRRGLVGTWPSECVLEKPFGPAELYERLELLALRSGVSGRIGHDEGTPASPE